MDESPEWAVDVAYGQFTSDLAFPDDAEMALHQKMVSAGVTWFLHRDWSIRAGIGAIVDGEFKGDAGKHNVLPGFVGSLRGNWRGVHPDGWIPFVDLGLTAAFSWSKTESQVGDFDTTLMALDMRFSTTVGWTLWEIFSPYISGRVFGGPVMWNDGNEDVTGSDPKHYQLAVGTNLVWKDVGGIFADWAYLGETGFSTGVFLVF